MRFYFVPNRRFWSLLTLTLILLFVVGTVSAQDTPSAPVSPLLDVPAPDVVGNSLIAAFYAIFAGVVASPVYSTIVAFAKRLPFLQGVSADAINLGVVALLVVVVYGAQMLAVRDQLDTLFKIILALSSVLGGTVAGAKSSSVWYSQVAKGVPVLGTPRKTA